MIIIVQLLVIIILFISNNSSVNTTQYIQNPSDKQHGALRNTNIENTAS